MVLQVFPTPPTQMESDKGIGDDNGQQQPEASWHQYCLIYSGKLYALLGKGKGKNVEGLKNRIVKLIVSTPNITW